MDRYNISRGPVKLIERAWSQAQYDYADEDYPVSARILGINCLVSFTFIHSFIHCLSQSNINSLHFEWIASTLCYLAGV